MTENEFGRLRERLRATVVAESSPDGEVQVIVDCRGVLTHVHFAESVRGADPAWLAAEVMATLRRAHAMLSGRVQELLPDGDAAAVIIGDYEKRFPTQA